MKASLILDIIRAHFEGDDRDFREAVERLASDEDRKGNSALALEIRKAARGARSSYREDRSRIARPQSIDEDEVGDAGMITVMHPEVSLDDLVLDAGVRRGLHEVIAEWEHPERLPPQMHPINTVLMTGPPGCGKTATAKALASALGKDLAYVRLDSLISQYLGQTGANIRKVFDSVSGKGMVLFIDEFDAIAKSRGDPDDVGESKRLLTTLLQNMDLMDPETLLVAATNMPELIDPAVTRRFGMILRFSIPSMSERELMIEMLASRYGLGNEYDLNSFVALTEGMSYADIETTFESVLRYVSVNEVRGPLDGAFLRSFINHQETGRDIWDMRESGMKLRQISEVTGIPISTLSYRFRRGRR